MPNSTAVHPVPARLGYPQRGSLVRKRRPCASTRAFRVLNRATGEVICPRCKRWDCEGCGQARQRAYGLDVERFIGCAQRDGMSVGHSSLTIDGEATVADVRDRATRHVRALRDRFPSLRYSLSIHGWARPHAHLIHASAAPISERTMRELAIRAGFGPNLRTRLVGHRREDRVALARYVVRQARQIAVTFGLRRPVTFSRNARPGDSAPQPLRPAYPRGSWLRVRVDPDRPDSLRSAVARVLGAERREQLRRAVAFFDRIAAKRGEVIPDAV
jgi:hypothetical protein